MPLTEYVGSTPPDAAGDVTVSRVAQHHYWTGESDVTDCPNCDAEISLRERHLLVSLDGEDDPDASTRYLCNEACLAEWLGGE